MNMNKLILTQIIKNEEHIISRWLDSVKDIVDGIVIVDTGSTDNSVKDVKEWGKKNKIDTHVFEREFDNFENSRNFSMEKAREIYLNKDNHTYYGFWLDADEVIQVGPTFDKQKLNRDIYMFNTHIGSMKYTRNELYRLDKSFKFWGPVHEFIVPSDSKEKLTSGLCEGIDVIVRMDGGSWKEETAKKYRKHANILEDYIDNVDRDPRWIFYTAQSYHDSSSLVGNEPENHERLRRALKYYTERLGHNSGYVEERFYAQFRIGTITYRLQRPFEEVEEQLLKAYRIDPLRGEPFSVLIEHYQQQSDWNMAYMYSNFAYNTYHNNNPYPNRVLFLDSKLYEWKFLELYANSCYHTGRKDVGRKLYLELTSILDKFPNKFDENDRKRINTNKTFFLQQEQNVLQKPSKITPPMR